MGFTLKHNSNCNIARYEAQSYSIDYEDTLSPIAKLNLTRVHNVFLYGDLHEVVYILQPPSKVVLRFGFQRNEVDHFMFTKKTNQRLISTTVNEETGMFGCRSVGTLMDPSIKLSSEIGQEVDVGKFQHLVGKLIYIIVTRLDISFCINWFGSPYDRKSAFECYTMTKHIEIDYYFIREKLQVGVISMHYILSKNQLVNIFTKAIALYSFHESLAPTSTYLTFTNQLEEC
ncbi:uncharacterized protein [Aristolochia californica]|uniref:uncharacterized protein n=1 Tax=Aristolochia californica TaxID=171875 RepID=UPI0035DCD8A6